MNLNAASTSPVNFPNLLTTLRLLLSVVLFILISIAQEAEPGLVSRLYWIALVIFIVAASTDWVDGFWARRYGQVTVVGRIFDPFVDKVIICGTFIFLVASPNSQVAAWMAVVVTGRELLVTALRGFFEQRGTDFSAKMAGKLKMVLQCLAVIASLYLLTFTENKPPTWLTSSVLTILWAAILLTIYSGGEYVVVAIRLARK